MNVALVAIGLLGTAACNPFLTDVSSDPNRPGTASIQQLFVGVQSAQFALQEGVVPMEMCLWTQACGATNGRFVQQAYNYVFGEGTDIASNSGDWELAYDAGGLVDIRRVEALAAAAGDSVFLGVAKIWEAFAIGTAADMWGNIPYSEALVSATPTLDNQADVYTAIQNLLNQAIAEIGTKIGAGPGDVDLVFGGDPPSWIAAANTLKARYFLHTAESVGQAAYDSALKYAALGISDNTGASDLASTHTGATSERNMWTQFQTSSGFGNDLEAGKVLVDFMKARSDPRLSSYFCKNGATAGLPYGGDSPNAAQPGVSNFLCLPPRFGATTRIPYVSYAENELILAEGNSTAKVSGSAGSGNDATALTHVNNVRHYVNRAFPPVAPLQAVPDAPAVTGATLLDSIMIEKYMAMFQNIEIMSGYQRECIPGIPLATNNRGFSNIPARLYYPQDERNTNPNIPLPSTQQSTNGFRNPLDPHGCLGDSR
jgi:hypothetical protein